MLRHIHLFKKLYNHYMKCSTCHNKKLTLANNNSHAIMIQSIGINMYHMLHISNLPRVSQIMHESKYMHMNKSSIIFHAIQNYFLLTIKLQQKYQNCLQHTFLHTYFLPVSTKQIVTCLEYQIKYINHRHNVYTPSKQM